MHESTWAYVAICIVVPMAWGLLTEWVFGKVEGYLHSRRKPSPDRAQPQVIQHSRTPSTLDYRI